MLGLVDIFGRRKPEHTCLAPSDVFGNGWAEV
jgi:hypothetical protein